MSNFLQDTFGATDGTAIIGRTAAPTGGVWAAMSISNATGQIFSNHLRNVTGGDTEVNVYNADTVGAPSSLVKWPVKYVTGLHLGCYAGVMWDNASGNGYMAGYSGNPGEKSLQLFKCTGNSLSALQQRSHAAADPAAGETWNYEFFAWVLGGSTYLGVYVQRTNGDWLHTDGTWGPVKDLGIFYNDSSSPFQPSNGGSVWTWVAPDADMVSISGAEFRNVPMGFVGDSITAGSFLSDPASQCPPEQEKLYIDNQSPGAVVAITNEGVGGSASGDWLSGSANLIAAKAAFATAGVTTVSLMLGANDAKVANSTTKSQFQANIQNICNDLVGAGYTVVLNQPTYIIPGSGSGDWDSTCLTLLPSYSLAMDAVCNGTTVLRGDRSAYSQFNANQATWFHDGVHPNETGAQNLGNLWGAAFLNPPSSTTAILIGSLSRRGIWASILSSNSTPSAPVNLTPPGISGNDPPRVGDTLTAVPGTYSGSPTSYAYTWPGGATGTTYVVLSSDAGTEITLSEVATNATGSSSPTSSSPTTKVPPYCTAAPVIDDDGNGGGTFSSPKVSDLLFTASAAVWVGADFINLQWYSDSSQIAFATSDSFSLNVGQVGTVVKLRSTASNVGGSTDADSNVSGIVTL